MKLALTKDKSIEIILEKLFSYFGEDNFCLMNYWDDDLCAVGFRNLTNKKYLIYVSTYQKPQNSYFLEVEKANSQTELTDYDVVERFEEINTEKLFQMLEKYLFLSQ